jgi:MoaA/NifB/PqqE/SkfB family radical SAM enzyme
MQSLIYKVQDADQIERLELELTSICNLKCPLCIRSLIDLPEHDYRPLDEILNQLDSYKSLKFVTIAGAIAEPTSHPNLLDIIKYLKKRNIEISLYINGDTRTDSYYTKLGVLFRNSNSNVYFTMCGSTQELHEKYRVNSKLERVLRRLNIVNRYSGNRGILTWIVFNYNQQDFEENYQNFKNKYRTEFFYTLPMDEHFDLKGDIRLPDNLHKIYKENVDRTDFADVECPANKNNFVQVTYDGKVYPCSLYRLYGEKHCFECSSKNLNILRNNKIFNVAEPESEDSEINLRLYYDSPQIDD